MSSNNAVTYEELVTLEERREQQGLEPVARMPLTGQPILSTDVSPVAMPPQRMYGQNGAKIGWRESSAEKGRGVFALEDIPMGEEIEVAPVIVVAAASLSDDGGAPDGYLLDWEPEEEGYEHCMPLGYIMLYNHSKDATIRLENDHEDMTITAYAARDIKAGEELTWDYNCEIWFDED